MSCDDIRWSGHAIRRMFTRSVTPAAVSSVIAEGEVIDEYPDDRPFPSVLLLGFVEGSPLHVVVARDPTSGTCVVVTVYVPDAMLWSPDFKKRRSP